MGEIFRLAATVIVWLGDSDATTQSVWSLLQQLRLAAHLIPMHIYNVSNGRIPTTGDKSVRYFNDLSVTPELARLPAIDDCMLQALNQFLDRRWFARLWTLQEVALSERCYVLCGEYVMSWSDLSTAALCLLSIGYNHVTSRGAASIIVREYQRRSWQSGERSELRELLDAARTCGFQTRYDHDKIFSLIPLVSDHCALRHSIRYSRPLNEIFTEAAKASILEDRCLAILGLVDLRFGHLTDVASWVPDWRRPHPTAVSFNSRSAKKQIYRAAGPTEPTLRTSALDVLVVRGILIAPVERILHIHRHLDLNSSSIKSRDLSAMRWAPEMWHKIYRQAVTKCDLPISVVKQTELPDRLPSSMHAYDAESMLLPIDQLQSALRRTLTGDLYPRPTGRVSPDGLRGHAANFDAWEANGFSDELLPAVLWEHDSMVKSTMTNRRLFVAEYEEEAFIGIGLRSLKPGDWICVLLGGDTPFILRPGRAVSTMEEAHHVEHWQFVSECYVHGLMDGEAMDRVKEPRFEYKDFVLPGPSVQSKL
jgi:hypothetical protein